MQPLGYQVSFHSSVSLLNFPEKIPMKKLTTFASILMLLPWQSASANSLFCRGTVEQMYVTDSSQVLIEGSWHTSWTMICDLDSTWNGITAELCKTWFAMALTAYQANSEVMVKYTNPPSADCATLPTDGAAPAPVYFMLRY